MRATTEVILNNGARQQAWIYWVGARKSTGVHMDSLEDRTQNVIVETDRLRFATWRGRLEGVSEAHHGSPGGTISRDGRAVA